jgi:murein tripeptide amidase MpaA
MTFSITSAFDSGNIRVLHIDGHEADLEIETDHGSDFYQWFHFRVGNAAGRDITLRLTNVAGSAYPLGWPDYRARISEDRETWRQADTDFDGKALTIRVRPETNALWVAYFAPYSMERHYDLITRMAARPGVCQRELTRTLDGRPLDALTMGEGPRQVWLYARQHPGETMAEWWMEGALEKLTDPKDATAKALRAKATLHIVPNMNPDGSFRGHLRTNAAGVNLNREWHAPSEERSPEVLAVRDAMDATGVDFAMDVHGDEAIPANFIAGFEGIPSYSEEKGALYTRFRDSLAKRSPDFQVAKGYEVAPPGKANMSMSTTQLAERYGAVSMTLEMPFKDHADNPDPEFGWSPARCKRLAHDCLDNLAAMIDAI